MDQTIEKVSFCAPDRNLDKAFSYICRDGTTRRWICHCFLALKDSVSISRAQGLLTLLSHSLAVQLHPRPAEWSHKSPHLSSPGLVSSSRKGTLLRALSLENYCGLEWANTQELEYAWHVGGALENTGYHRLPYYEWFFLFL